MLGLLLWNFQNTQTFGTAVHLKLQTLEVVGKKLQIYSLILPNHNQLPALRISRFTFYAELKQTLNFAILFNLLALVS